MQANAFARSKAMFAAIQAAMAIASLVERESALSSIGPYQSRGKGKGKRAKSRHCVAMDKRAAVKARNVKRHKAH